MILVYEYKNDCLTAALKSYNKTLLSVIDDLKFLHEDLFFTADSYFL